MQCGYCHRDQQDLAEEGHSLQCQMFRSLNDNKEARYDPYASAAVTMMAAYDFALAHEGSMTDHELSILRDTIDTLREKDIYL